MDESIVGGMLLGIAIGALICIFIILGANSHEKTAQKKQQHKRCLELITSPEDIEGCGRYLEKD